MWAKDFFCIFKYPIFSLLPQIAIFIRLYLNRPDGEAPDTISTVRYWPRSWLHFVNIIFQNVVYTHQSDINS